MSELRFVEREGPDGRPEYYMAGGDGWVVYCPPPGQSSAPRSIKFIRDGGFVGTRAAMADVCGPYRTRSAAEAAAHRDAEVSGYPEAMVI